MVTVNNEIIEIQLETPEVIDASGLNLENWENGKQYWIEQFDNEITEELKYL